MAESKNQHLNIASKIRKIREIKGFSQEYVASRLEVTQNTYSKIERGETSLSVEKPATICEIDFNTLFNFDENLIFNNCTQTGNFGNNNTLVLNTVEKLQEVYDKLIQSKDSEIAILKEVVHSLNKK
jgi:transcriptional regulator with XRE-family HTH domain